MIQAVEWREGKLRILDQSKLPEKTEFRDLTRMEEVFEAIRNLQVRGAPLIGIAAAYGLYLAMRNSSAQTREAFLSELAEAVQYLASARPTAVNLEWALQRVQQAVEAHKSAQPQELKQMILRVAREIHQEDQLRCQRIARFGQEVILARATILTHCNTGILATGGIGTALGIVYRAVEEGKKIQVLASETRPLLQGARLTVWELQAHQVPVTLLCDNMAGWAMRSLEVDLVLVGADRIAADGSTANKIGTYSLAQLARAHGIPFYVAAPLSSFDLNLPTGEHIPIEQRSPEEVRTVLGKCPIAPEETRCWNPAFDVTPPELITGIITDFGIARPPYERSIAKLHQNVQNSIKLEGEPL